MANGWWWYMYVRAPLYAAYLVPSHWYNFYIQPIIFTFTFCSEILRTQCICTRFFLRLGRFFFMGSGEGKRTHGANGELVICTIGLNNVCGTRTNGSMKQTKMGRNKIFDSEPSTLASNTFFPFSAMNLYPTRWAVMWIGNNGVICTWNDSKTFC